MDTHTPKPWFVFGNGLCVGGRSDNNPNAATAGIAMCGMRLRSPEENEANAALIVRAVNTHNDLLAVVKALVDDEPCRHDHHGQCQTHFTTMEDGTCANVAGKAAIKKAEAP